jgi:GTP cyclohydrolase II
MEYEKTKFRSIYGEGTLHCFNNGPHEEDNILVIEPEKKSSKVLVRVQSACYTAEIFRSTDCDCHQQLDESLKQIFNSGGLCIYMLCDGRGAGLLKKIKALNFWETEGIDTHEAYKRMGIETDPRTYEKLKPIFEQFKITDIELLTNNPRKIAGLQQLGLTVSRRPLEVDCHRDAKPYLETKKNKMGHLFLNIDAITEKK